MIKQTHLFSATPEELYDIFIDDKKHADFTGAKAKIENKVGGKFSVWDDYATGKNMELVPGKKIIQSWRASDWPEGINSMVTFVLNPKENGTQLEFTHEGVPPEFSKEIEEGWEDYYWKPLVRYLKK